MKFMMNGAVTIGTLDGANVEILEEVGEDNFFLFGMKVDEVQEHRHHYDPAGVLKVDQDLHRVMELLKSGHFNQFEGGIFDDIIASLMDPADPWVTLADFRSYVDAQNRAEAAFKERKRWLRMSVINCARSGRFSTDRTMEEYNRDIWKLEPIEIEPVDESKI
jgi:starch phosphorylase